MAVAGRGRSTHGALGETQLAAALSARPALDGLVCSNDSLALGVLFAAQRRGLAVPSRLRVIGFGDLPFAGHAIPPLTTIRPTSAAIGRAIARLVLDAEGGGALDGTTTRIDPVLVERDSA